MPRAATMTLDLSAIAQQVGLMAAAAPWRDDGPGFDEALRLLADSDPAALTARIDQSRTSWLVARLLGALDDRVACPTLPPTWSVLATDGSSMTPDRHSPVVFYLINIGRVRLTYGPQSSAAISAMPTLCYQPDETHLALPDGVRRLPIDGARLAAKRAVDELLALADLAETCGPPAVALQDGTLILWSLQSEEEAVQAWAVEPFLGAMARLRAAGVPLAGYISAPGSTDVVNALRVAACPHVPHELPTIDCEHCPSRGRPDGPACSIIPPTTDRWLFERVLRPGERSAVFTSASKVLERYRRRDPAHDIAFFYLHTGQEIARVETPRWVADEPDWLDRVHAVVADQARRGDGYPPVLQEAHEAAVIAADERRLVEHLIEDAMARVGVTMIRSAKDTSKRVRRL